MPVLDLKDHFIWEEVYKDIVSTILKYSIITLYKFLKEINI